jgi:arginase
MDKSLSLIGYANGEGAADIGCEDGPHIFKQSRWFKQLVDEQAQVIWDSTFCPSTGVFPDKFSKMQDICLRLALRTQLLAAEKKRFIVLGGDHSSAIGTWSGVYEAVRMQGSLGLIWVDAHMDSHTPENTRSGNIHGMPLATLLGYGRSSLTNLLSHGPKLLPEQVCLIGIRSFEPEEADLLHKLQVRIFDMQEVQQRGLKAVLVDALAIVQNNTVGFGVSVDLDAFDPYEVPAVGTPEKDGLSAKEFCELLAPMIETPNFLGAEIAEFNPHRDKNHQTEAVIYNLMKVLS